MKKPQSNLLETSRAESDSRDFESLFAEYWAYVYRILHRLVGSGIFKAGKGYGWVNINWFSAHHLLDDLHEFHYAAALMIVLKQLCKRMMDELL